MAKAAPILLEPISQLEVTVPAAYQGDVMGDLNGRRGRVQGTEAGDDGESIVTALVPTSEILRYAIDLRSMTGGRGRFHAEHDHYDPLAPQPVGPGPAGDGNSSRPGGRAAASLDFGRLTACRRPRTHGRFRRPRSAGSGISVGGP